MTKAERIYKDTKYECQRHIKSWGFDNTGFNRMNTEELVHQRTVNEIKRLIAGDYYEIGLMLDFQMITEDEAREKEQVIKMVELTLANQYIA